MANASLNAGTVEASRIGPQELPTFSIICSKVALVIILSIHECRLQGWGYGILSVQGGLFQVRETVHSDDCCKLLDKCVGVSGWIYTSCSFGCFILLSICIYKVYTFWLRLSLANSGMIKPMMLGVYITPAPQLRIRIFASKTIKVTKTR